MTLRNEQNPIVKKFKEAARSCNEWRDTLYYTGVGAVAIAATQWNLGVKADDIIFAASIREFLRFNAWSLTMSSLLSRGGGNFRHSQSAAFITLTADMAITVARGVKKGDLQGYITSHSSGIAVLLAMSSLAYVNSGGIKNIYAAYRDTMFDYPRKKNPPPKRRKEPALEKFNAAWQGLKGKLGPPLPEGAFAPLTVRRRALAATKNIP